jgi:Mrp family chromosome partitioning ATPase
MGVLNSVGLTDLLGDSTLNVKDVASKLSGSELWLLTSGASPIKEKECLVHSYRMRDRIAELRSCFDYVLIDAPAMSVCNDALALGQWADGVTLVLRAGSTRRDFALSVKAELSASGVNVLGAILNDYASPIPKAIEKWF